MLKLADRKQQRLSVLRSESMIASPPAIATSALSPPSEDKAVRRLPEAEPLRDVSVVHALVQHLAALGVEQAFGVSGGAIAMIYDALAEGPIGLRHFRHESGAAFAAAEASFASQKPTAVFATTGPGLLNAITGLTAARWDGAKVVLISGATSAKQRGRWATQETSAYTLPQDAFYSKGPIFDFGVRMESVAEWPQVARRLAQGMARPGGFVAHVCLPMSVQSARVSLATSDTRYGASTPAACADEVAHIARQLKEGSFAIWAGFGATQASALVRELATRSGARVFCSPRAKGVMPEGHPLYLGVSGLGGHQAVNDFMHHHKPDRILVLGTRLGEATSFWDRDLLPAKGLIHVDVDAEAPGTAFPDAETMGVQAEIGQFLRELLRHFPMPANAFERPVERPAMVEPDEPVQLPFQGRSPVRPQVLMNAIQRRVVQASDAVVMAECGNSFAWCNHHLHFATSGRYRVSTLFGSMGHMAAGVVGAALARDGKAVAVVGDGSMLMNSELSTAAQYRAQAVWIILNDAGYGMCRDGQRTLGLSGDDISFPRVDFAKYARAVGADGVVVESEDELDEAIAQAMAADGPFVVDVRIDPSEPSPLLKRFESLIKQGGSKHVAGWETR
jgi:acetolactate synthase-1/2/3 large subunit